MGPESAALQIIRLIAHEAEREGNDVLVKELRELQLRTAYSEDVTVEPMTPKDGKEIDVGRIHRISALIKSGDVAANENSEECMIFYNQALSLAEDSTDLLRPGEIHLALARAHLNVTALRDAAKYEHHARKALNAAFALGPLGADLKVRASLSMGNAIIEEQRQQKQPAGDRLNEARDALIFAATAAEADANTRGSAHLGLGHLLRIEGDIHGAASEYLAGCKEFESGDKRSLLKAQTHAAVALAESGKIKDAQTLALEAIAGLNQDPATALQLLPSLKGVLAAGESR
jgi:hypothetical protein